MHVELFGCTGAGKSTLAHAVLRTCRSRGVKVVLGDDFVLQQVRLDWVRLPAIRTLLVDLCALVACLLTCPANLWLYVLSLRMISRLPGDVSWFEKLNLVRNVFRKTGIYEIIRRRRSDECFVVVDEGTLHAAHNLFVHVSAPPPDEEVTTFARLVALPEVAIYVAEAASVLVERTARRGHKRIVGGSEAEVERFVMRAVDTFDRLLRDLVAERRVLALEGEPVLFVRPDCQGDPSLSLVAQITRSSAGLNRAGQPEQE
jgi:hypothetical protein